MIAQKNRIESLFETKDDQQKVMSLFLTAGYPDLESTADLVVGFEKNGADMIELGMPFSDPLADGPTIQEASNVAIENGITMDGIFDMVKKIRESSQIPVILMGYINPVFRYGVEKFCRMAEQAGVDGLIIPDAPIEESGILSEHAAAHGLHMIYLVAPNTSSERMKVIDQKSDGFVYCVSVTGVTGARDGNEVAQSVQRFISRVKDNVQKNPKLVGFGIKNHNDAMKISDGLDGFIVGSALIETIRSNYPDQGWQQKLFSFVKDLKYGNS
ncbi:MAG TPA: tryptophan synthase subunit alpha [Balneolaceae bacterium]|nr:tryptophan synthase subunit alpha [Balneolaceae bacterium]